ncbi:phosphatases II, partial [Sistotremastrum niveocremeum HHB9708]
LGNLLLSSCPGKKVRLTGPIRGRGAICRDLYSDLRRIKDSNVGCIICCLDDDELEFLGAGWAEYAHAAKQVGIPVYRIPMPEGLTPLSLPTFNCQLDTLIQNYTIRGKTMLVHCRGGVGRAGLVACCWMLKLGLCGWLPDNDPCKGDMPEGQVRKGTLELVEKAILVVRRRRSVKAIETYEQVRFLVDYVEFLRHVG